MEKYYLRSHPQPNCDYEVHCEGCSFMPKAENRTYLGTFGNCRQAISAAKVYHTQVDGCRYCCYECHNS